MTFYNIIFGILFLGAVREILASLSLPSEQRTLAFWHAVILTLIIFSDVVYTSHVIEELKKPYKIWMKLLDLLNFIVLTLALISLDPSQNNVLQVSIEPILKSTIGLPTPSWVFWLLLTVYWLLLGAWVREGEIHPNKEQFDGLKDSPAQANSLLIRSPRAQKATWFLINKGRMIGLLCLLSLTLTAYSWSELLYYFSPLAGLLAIIYLVINGLILNLYKSS